MEVEANLDDLSGSERDGRGTDRILDGLRLLGAGRRKGKGQRKCKCQCQCR